MGDALSEILTLLQHTAEWPLESASVHDTTFEIQRSSIGFLRNELLQTLSIRKLRSIPGLCSTVYLVDQGDYALNRFAIRRIAIHLTAQRFASLGSAIALENLFFLVAHSSREASCAHFRGDKALHAEMAVAPLTKELAHEYLAWSQASSNVLRLDDRLYGRYTRNRSQVRCSLTFLIRHAPSKVEMFRQILSLDSLEQREEDWLFAAARTGREHARELLTLHHLGLVFDTATRYWHMYRDCHPIFDDVFSGGIEGLVIAMERYEPKRGHRFRSYAWQQIATKCERAINESTWPVNVPYYQWEQVGPSIRKLRLAQAVCEYPPQTESVAEYLELSDQLYEVILLMTGAPIEIEWSCLPDDSTDNRFARVEDRIIIPSQLDYLRPRERDVVLLRNGLHPSYWDVAMTLEQVAQIFQVTRERIRQIEVRAMKRIEQRL